MKATPPTTLWLVPALALLALLPLSDPERNQSLFLLLNQAAASLPAAIWASLTVLGDTLVALCLLLLLLRQRPDLVLAVLLVALPATLLIYGLKDVFDVARPYAVLGDQVHVIGRYLTMGSFPSGHTTTIFLLAAVVVGGLRPTTTTVLALTLALLVGGARIAVGAHWPLDVAGGIVCGWTMGLLGLYGIRRVDWAPRSSVVLAMRLLLITCALVLYFDFNSGYPPARIFEQAIALLVLVIHLLPGWHMESRT